MSRRTGSVAMRTVTASEFKAKCLAILEEVGDGGGDVVVTRHGKVVACLEGVATSRTFHRPSLAHYVRFSGDVESPIEVDWEASA